MLVVSRLMCGMCDKLWHAAEKYSPSMTSLHTTSMFTFRSVGAWEPGKVEYLDPLIVSRNKLRVGYIGSGRDLFPEMPAETRVGVYRAKYC